MATVEHLNLVGETVTFTGPLDLTAPATSVGVLVLDGVRREFTGGVKALAAPAVASIHGIDAFDEKYSTQNGTLSIGHRDFEDLDAGVQTAVWAGVWEGVDWCLLGHVYGAQDSSILLDLFGRLTIDETDLGVRAIPVASTGGQFEEQPIVAKQVPNFGLITVQRLTASLAESLPDWPGTAVAGGELYYDAQDGPHFMLVGDQSVATITPEVDAEKAAELLSQTVIDWMTKT